MPRDWRERRVGCGQSGEMNAERKEREENKDGCRCVDGERLRRASSDTSLRVARCVRC